jgi:tripartite-type tricarboxylate transporter receptor subunit TctC
MRAGNVTFLAGLAVVLLVSARVATAAAALDYPVKPIRLLVGFPAGSSLDIAARIVSNKLSELLGQNVIVDNRAGAAGNIAAEIVARARPDGYTLLMGANGALAINPALHRKLPYDSIRDFAPVSKVAVGVNVLAVTPSFPATTVEQLIALSRSKPLLGASSGVGSPGHLALALFNAMAKTNIAHVPYKGSTPALLDLMAGTVQMTFATGATTLPLMKSGKVRGLAVTSLQRSPLIPELPTVSESGLKGFEVTGWYGVLAPAGTPRAIIDRLNAALVRAMQMGDVKHSMEAQGISVTHSTPEEFGAFIKSEVAKWAGVVRLAGAKAE